MVKVNLLIFRDISVTYKTCMDQLFEGKKLLFIITKYHTILLSFPFGYISGTHLKQSFVPYYISIKLYTFKE